LQGWVAMNHLLCPKGVAPESGENALQGCSPGVAMQRIWDSVRHAFPKLRQE
jgi:hypothetical protein